MKTAVNRGWGRPWSLGWVILIRSILYLVVVGFLLQYIYFGEIDRIHQPGECIVLLLAVFMINLCILTLGSESSRVDQVIALTYILDIAVLTRVMLASGGFNSVFIPYYLPMLIMSTAWLPRRYTAVFPSVATLGAAYIGFGHLMTAMGETGMLPWLYPRLALDLLRYSPSHTIVANMLILTVLFFIISYLTSIVSDRLFLEQRLNAEVLSSMREGVAVVNGRGQLSFANAEFHRMFPEVTDGNFAAIAADMLASEESGRTLENLLEQKFSDSLVITHDNLDKPERPPMEVRVSGITLRRSDEVFGLVFMATDLSLRRRMEAAERNLARFSAISTMSAGLAHEIRNPLASLRSAIQEIGDAFQPGSQNRTLTDIVISESDRLDRIIGRFLDFSREGELRPSRCRLGVMLEELRTMLLHNQAARNLEMTVTAVDDPDIRCDEDRIKEVFYNLALNAAQAVPRTGGKLDVRLELAEKGGVPGVQVSFLDNGPGIGKDALDHLFEPFFSQREGGTGMGLSLVRKQVSMHDGEITVTNLDGGGACFRVWLPLEPVSAAESQRLRRRGSYAAVIRSGQPADD